MAMLNVLLDIIIVRYMNPHLLSSYKLVIQIDFNYLGVGSAIEFGYILTSSGTGQQVLSIS